MESYSVITAHGAYDALPAREADNLPEGAQAVLTVFCEDGALAGWVSVDCMRADGLVYLGVLAEGEEVVGRASDAPGAVDAVAEHDQGI